MKTIRTKYLPPTAKRGSRYRADDGNGNVIVISADHGLSATENHVNVFHALCARMRWAGEWAQGQHSNECLFVRVAVDVTPLHTTPRNIAAPITRSAVAEPL